MTTLLEAKPALEVLADIGVLLDSINPDRGLLTDADRLDLVTSARRTAGRLQAFACLVAAEASAVEAAEHQVGVPLASWLTASDHLTRKEAHRLIGQGCDLVRFPDLAAAALAGRVGIDQAHAISGVLKLLPDDFSTAQVRQAEQTMLQYAHEFDSNGLKQLSRHLVEVLDPDGCDERDARRLERDLKTAKDNRHLTFSREGHGSISFHGSLPTVDAEPFIHLVEAYAQAQKRTAQESLDPTTETITVSKRRADGLCALIAAHQLDSLAPTCGGDRPRIVVVLDYHQLTNDCIKAGILGTGEPITADELRMLACDADILPAVLGGASEVLDVGRAQRLVTPAIRTALALRDGGCVFPGCDVPVAVCHAHHLIPWWAGGPTSLENLALACPHHHNLIEPTRTGPTKRRWEVVMGADGIPEILPPDYVDPHRTPRRHQRHRLKTA